MKITIIHILTIIPSLCLASNVSYTYSVESLPANQSGFYYSDGRGNSVSFQRTQNVPVIINNYPNAVWAPMTNGSVPPNAIIMQYVNGFPVYFCKVQINNQIVYGQLFPGEGCVLADDEDNRTYQSYSVLIR